MQRYLLNYLRKWQFSPLRTPLIIRGARQVGKSHVVREFGRTEFSHFLEINLETQQAYHSAFASRQAKEICVQISALSRQEIVPNKTLLFFDEIQSSPDALVALRSFKEDLPDLHVIAAGSLLEFALQDANAPSFPVGRVTFAFMYPMSFQEFLLAMNEGILVDHIGKATFERAPGAAIHARLLELLRTYFTTGGMPEVVEALCVTKSFIEAKRVQNRLVTAFIADFAKYGHRYDYRKLQIILNAAPRLVGRQFKYSHIDPKTKARDLKQPLLDLESAGLVRRVRASSANGVPLGAEERERHFKIQCLDIGLMLNALGVDLLTMPAHDALFVNEGALAEQFVGQELAANLDPESRPELYYWSREVPEATAEVDFVLSHDSRVVPVEVKSGSTGRLKSLRQFMKDKDSSIGIRISQHPLSWHEGIMSVPLYMCSEISRLLSR